MLAYIHGYMFRYAAEKYGRMTDGLPATERPTLRDFVVRLEREVLLFGGTVVRTRSGALPNWTLGKAAAGVEGDLSPVVDGVAGSELGGVE